MVALVGLIKRVLCKEQLHVWGSWIELHAKNKEKDSNREGLESSIPIRKATNQRRGKCQAKDDAWTEGKIISPETVPSYRLESPQGPPSSC